MQPYKGKIIYFPQYLDLSQRKLILQKNMNDANLIEEEYVWTDLSRIDLNALSENQYSSLFLGDESYAGSENFIKMNKIVKDIFEKDYVLPCHNIKGAWNLVIKTFEKYPNHQLAIFFYNPFEHFHLTNLINYYKIPYSTNANNSLSNGSQNQNNLISILMLNSVEIFGYGDITKLVENIRDRSALMIGDFSSIFSLTRADLNKIKHLSKLFDVIVIDACFDLMCNNGAILVTNDFKYYEYLTEWVVAFEGLHTYGGLAGRDMEVINAGLIEAQNQQMWEYKFNSMGFLYNNLKHLSSKHSNFKLTDSYTPHYFYISHKDPNINNTLFIIGQVRGYNLDNHLFIFLPSRRYQKQNLELFLDTFERYLSDPNITNIIDPRQYVSHNFKGIEIIQLFSFERREQVLKEAGYNTFLIPASEVYIDFLTDSGTSSISDEQWSKAILYDQKRAYNLLRDSIQEVFGFEYFLPTHQGRAAEHILSQTMIKPSQYVINNMYFTTTRFHQEYAKGIFVDLIIEEAYKPEVYHPFKGNIDVDRLVDFIEKNGKEKIAYVCVENNVNMAGGQPVSLDNLKQIRKICDHFGIPLVLDATRIAENAFFIKEREQGYQDKSIKEIIREIMSLADAATISAKKDPLTNISGLILVRSQELYKQMVKMLNIFEGEYYNGGLAPRDIAMLAQGILEMTDFYYLKNRIEQVRYLGNLLKQNNIPIVEPIGGHAIYLDAKRFLEHIPQDEFPAQTLAAYIYLYGGVRTMERGIVSAGRDPKTGKHKYPELELVRITIPRRVYSKEHMEYTCQVIKSVYDIRHEISGLNIVYEPPFLRFFTIRFEPIKQIVKLKT
ncbi:MAG: tryptophanase [bacterium]